MISRESLRAFRAVGTAGLGSLPPTCARAVWNSCPAQSALPTKFGKYRTVLARWRRASIRLSGHLLFFARFRDRLGFTRCARRGPETALGPDSLAVLFSALGAPLRTLYGQPNCWRLHAASLWPGPTPTPRRGYADTSKSASENQISMASSKSWCAIRTCSAGLLQESGSLRRRQLKDGWMHCGRCRLLQRQHAGWW